MVKHMIIWSLKEEMDKESVKAEIKKELEGLLGKIEGLSEMKILTEGFPCSAGDLMMDSTFESKAALEAYQSHPAHQAIANGLVLPHVASRASFDYEV